MNYFFFINYHSVVTQVYPLNWLECSLVDELQKDNVFYRRKFEGSLTFGGKKLCPDFDLFYNIETTDPCGRIDFLILQNTDIYWEGYFSTNDGNWDLDAKTFTVTPLLTDDYNIFLEEGEVEHNILSAGLALVPTTVFLAGKYNTTYTRNRWLVKIIEYLIQQIEPTLSWAGGTIVSTFFTNAINPVTLVANRYNLLTLAQKSDIKRPAATNPAMVGILSFNGLMEILKTMNLAWKYDGVTFRIEHISYWTTTAGLDIRTQELTVSTNKYRYTKESMPKYEKFEWMESYHEAFIGKPIWYDSNCVSQDPDNNVTEFAVDVTTDIEYILDSVAAGDDTLIKDDGWVLLANQDVVGVYYVYSNYSTLDNTILFNYDLSWEGLHKAFFKHGRQLITGFMNGIPTTFYSAKKIKEQVCSIIDCVAFDPTKYITTELGEDYFGGEKASVSKAVIKPYGEINLTLLYGPAETEIIPIISEKKMLITEQAFVGIHSVFYGVCNQPADIDLHVDISIWMKDAADNMCETATLTLTILAGATTGNITIPWCVPIVLPCVCILAYEYDTTGALGWGVTFDFDETAHC